MRILLIALLVCASAIAQTNVRQSARPSTEGTEDLAFRDGSGNTEYVCTADSPSATSSFARNGSGVQPNSSVALVNITNIVVASTTATVTFDGDHGLRPGNWITVSGATVDTDLNVRVKIATVGSSTTLTFTVANVTATTYTESTLRITTTAPRSNANVWSLNRLYYTGSAFDRSVWAQGDPQFKGSCDSRTTYF